MMEDLEEPRVAEEQPPEIRAAHHLALALEYVARARGHLLTMHHLIGHADNMLDQVVDELDEAGRSDLVELVRREVFGRDVVAGKWTYQLVEDFDAGYWEAWQGTEAAVRQELTGGKRFVHEATLQDRRRNAAG
jgi:hypothetical protein